jgi:peptidoglycan/xylan/chitin deacetylase (PgdA/CDA1 family)
VKRPLAVAALALALAPAGCGGSTPKHAAKAIPAKTPAPRTDAASMAARANVPVLCWHQIRPITAADSARDRPYIVSPKALAAQLDALDRAGYHPVTGEALVAHVAIGKPLPSKPVLLTFDDASAAQYTRALPLLRRHHFVATFFVMTVVLDKPGWLTTDQVRKLDRAGMTIGPHTYDHHAVPDYAGEDWDTQLVAPAAKLATIIGHPARLFAYPFGLWDREAFAHLDKAGYVAAFQLADKPLDRQEPLWTLRRIIVPELSGKELLRQMRRDF